VVLGSGGYLEIRSWICKILDLNDTLLNDVVRTEFKLRSVSCNAVDQRVINGYWQRVVLTILATVRTVNSRSESMI